MRWPVALFAVAFLLPGPLGADEQLRDPHGFVCGKDTPGPGDDAKERERVSRELVEASRKDFAVANGWKTLGENHDPLTALRREFGKTMALSVRFDSLESIRRGLRQLNGLSRAMDNWLDYSAAMESSIIRHMNQRRQTQHFPGFGGKDLEALITETKEQLKTVIGEAQGWSGVQKAQAIAEFDQVEPLTSSLVRRTRDRAERLLLGVTLLNGCGPNGEVQRAFTVTPATGSVAAPGGTARIIKYRNPAMVVCTRYITDQTDVRELGASLKFGIAHQLAHLISSYVRDPSEGSINAQGQVMHRDLSTLYTALHSCISKKQSDFADPKRRVKDLRKQAEQPSDTKIQSFEAMSAAAEADATELRLRNMQEILGHEPSAYETHQAEIEADYWAFRVLGRFLKGLPEDLRMSIRQSLSRLCGASDEGFYPSPKFRIEMAFQDEGVARGTGYQPATRCWLSGALPAVGEPGREQKGTSSLPAAR